MFAALVVIKSYLSYRSRQESLIMFVFWSATWVGIMVIAFYPEVITTLLGNGRVGIGTLLSIALVFVYFVVYRIYVKADRIEKRMNDIVRSQALKDLPARSRVKKPTKKS